LLYPQRPDVSVIARKAHSLLIPYFLWNLIYGISIWVLSHFIPSLREKLLMSSLIHAGYQLYFLPYMFGVMIFSALLFRQKCWWQNYLVLMVVFLIILGYSVVGFPKPSHGQGLDKFPLFLCSFLLGHLFPLLSRFKRGTKLCALLVSVSILVMIVSDGAAWSLFIAPLILLVISPFQDNTYLKYVSKAGRFSGSIYLWHTPLVLPFLTIVFTKMGLPPIYVLVASICLAIFSCILIKLIAEKFWIRVFSRPLPHWLGL
jgi:hypothetical protein